MGRPNNPPKTGRSDEDLARMIVNVANAAQADAIICATETGAFAQLLHGISSQIRVMAATTKRDTYDVLIQAGLEAILLPLRAIDKYSQVRHVVSVALKSSTVSVGDLIVCALGRDVYQEEGDLIVLTDVEHSVEHLSITHFLKLTDAIQPKVLEIAIAIACKIGRAARRGKRLGAIFMLGDSVRVLENSKQLIPNPFQGHDQDSRRLTNPDIHDAIVELSKLDGAFIVRGDGLIQTAGTFLTSPEIEVVLPAGLGARHLAAAAVTKRTTSTAVVVSATDGNVRVFSGGSKVLHIDPEVPYGPITTEV
ncbi:MAG: DNA integrity scanning protein DisA nucleotide-binding domain protein [Deltaproteobacteria bacterium]|nr:DNA integrity scanning protein DisA nucleotide-binding domain protein [Deltaproteobacteria bacterium]